jgi:DNA-binding response OmpR family regulator
MRVLVTEDDAVTALFVQRILEQNGHEVIMAKDGNDAWELIKNDPFDMLILDWMLPGYDGLTLTEMTRNSAMNLDSYIVIMSSKLEKEDRIHAFDLGINNLILKPVDHVIITLQTKSAEKLLQLKSELYKMQRAAKIKRDFAKQVVSQTLQTLGLSQSLLDQELTTITQDVEMMTKNANELEHGGRPCKNRDLVLRTHENFVHLKSRWNSLVESDKKIIKEFESIMETYMCDSESMELNDQHLDEIAS